MYKKYQPDHLYQNNITTVSCPDFYFEIHYAEQMNQSIPEFLHRHDLYEIYYVMKGSMECWCVGKVHELKEGNLMFVGKNLEHHMIYNPQNKGEYFVLIFDIASKNTGGSKNIVSDLNMGMEYCEIKSLLDRIDQEKYIIPAENFFALELIQEIYNEQKQKQIGWNSLMGALYFHFFLKALRLLSPEISGIRTPFGYMNVALTATKYIHQNYQEEINLKEVASLLNVTSRHINRLFKEMFGIPFVHTVNIIRMHYAKQYLNTNKSIEWIADRVGLSSAKTLTKLFKEQEGISPAKYRILLKKEVKTMEFHRNPSNSEK